MSRGATTARSGDGGPGARAAPAPLTGVRVLEVGDEWADFCGRLLAGLGADVVKAEPPEGSPGRAVGPFAGDDPGPDRSLAFWADNVGKRSAIVRGDDEVRALCAAADVLVHTLRPAACAVRGLDWPALHDAHPGLVVCAVTPFGQDGPWADYLADDLVLMALGGSMAACGYGPGRDGAYDTPPLASHGDQAWRTAATYAAIAVLGALLWRGGGGFPHTAGAGQFIDVSAHECSASMTEWHLMTYLCSGAVHRRGPHPTLTAADGRQVAALNPDFLGPHVFTRMLEMLDAEDVAGPLADPAFADPAHRAANYREVWRALKRLAEKHDGETLYRLGQAAGLPWGVIRSPEEVLEDRHLQARGHFVALEHEELGRAVTYPGAPFLAPASPWVARRRPPRLGEHTAAVAAAWGVTLAGAGVAAR